MLKKLKISCLASHESPYQNTERTSLIVMKSFTSTIISSIYVLLEQSGKSFPLAVMSHTLEKCSQEDIIHSLLGEISNFVFVCAHIDICLPVSFFLAHSLERQQQNHFAGYQGHIQIAFILYKPVGNFNGFLLQTSTSILEKCFSLNLIVSL